MKQCTFTVLNLAVDAAVYTLRGHITVPKTDLVGLLMFLCFAFGFYRENILTSLGGVLSSPSNLMLM